MRHVPTISKQQRINRQYIFRLVKILVIVNRPISNVPNPSSPDVEAPASG